MLPLQSTDKKIQFLRETIVSELQKMNVNLGTSSLSHSHQGTPHQSTPSQPHQSTSSQQATLTSTLSQPHALSPEEHTSRTPSPSQPVSVELVSCSLEGEGEGEEGGEEEEEVGKAEEDGGNGGCKQASGEEQEGDQEEGRRRDSEVTTEGKEGREGEENEEDREEESEEDREEESEEEIEVPRVMDEEPVLDMCATLGNTTPLKLSPGNYKYHTTILIRYTDVSQGIYRLKPFTNQ